MRRKWTDHGGNSCPSCLALAGQVHEEWPFEPGDRRLYCTDHCHCTLDDTDEPESGDLSSVPLRQETTMQNNQHRITIHAQMAANAAPDRFEVLFIQATEANGYAFSRAVLEESIAQWEQCSVFVDHAMFGRSVRDLGGVLANVAYSDQHNGLTAELTPCGPSAEIVREAARIMLAGGPLPNLGFSADLLLTADAQNNVEKIMQPLSVDLVIDPAFATRFIRQLNSKGVQPMAPNPTPAPADDKTAEDLQHATQVEQGKQLVELTLQNANLPEAAAQDVRARFAGNIFQPAELTAAVDAWQKSLAAIEAPAAIQGPARVSGMFDSRDQFQAALDDLLGAHRDKGSETLKVQPLTGIREAYIGMTGDRDFTGGFFKDRVQFTHVAASFPGLLVNALNKALQDHWQQLGRAGYDWWQKIATIEHFNSVQDIAWLLVGTIGSLPTVSENGEYTELKVGDSKETSSFTKYGGYIGLSLEAMDKDDTRKLRLIPRELANAGLRNISSLVAAIFTQNSAAGPTLADTGALFNNTAVTTKGGHKNLLTTALGTDYTAWDAVALAMYDQPMLIASEAGYYGTGSKCALWPKYVLVPSALKSQADALFMPRWQAEVDAVATKGGPTWGGRVEVVTVPEWTDTTDWAAAQDPALMPGIMIGERFGIMPQIFVAGNETDPAMFSNDESRIKVRHMLAVGVADFRPLHKSNV